MSACPCQERGWPRCRAAVYVDGTPVMPGDHIRYRQAPGGFLPRGDWREGVAVADAMCPGELVLSSGGRRFNLFGHEVERVQ